LAWHEVIDLTDRTPIEANAIGPFGSGSGLSAANGLLRLYLRIDELLYSQSQPRNLESADASPEYDE
jgi:hypothetical protein